jgi:O-antigen ligase
MDLYNRIEGYLPFFLPLLLFFSRSIADITVITISILFLSKSFYHNDFEWLSISWIKIFILFLIYLIIFNTPLSSNSIDSLFYSLGFIRWPLFALAISFWIFKERKSLDYFLIGSLLVGLIFLIDLSLQFYLDDGGFFGASKNMSPGRLSVPFSDNVIPGRLLIYLWLFISSIILFQSENIKNIYSFFVLTFTSFFLIIISGERMALMIFVSAVLLIDIAILNKKNLLKIILFNFSLLILVYFLFVNEPQTSSKISSISQKLMSFWESDYGIVFITSLQKWMQNPFFGSGIHQFQSIEPIYGYGIMEKTKILHAHNYPLNLLVETGLIGLTLFYAIIFFIIKEIVSRARNNLSLMIFLITIIYVSFFPFHSHFKLSHNWMNAISWFSIGLIFSILNFNEKNSKN